jgi:hypothetical protein
MLWLTWRQHRWPIITSVVVTAGMTIWMLLTAAQLGQLAKECAVQRCSGDLAKAASYATYEMNTVVFLPVLIAVFWGVPLLAREYEQRTLPLAWSQDVSPLRWLTGKTAILGTLVAVMGTALAGSAARLAHQYQAYTRFSLFEGSAFQAGGWLPLTLALAWLALGIAAGAATRRTMPAIAVVAGLWIVRMVGIPRWREQFMAPLHGFKLIGEELGGAAGQDVPLFHTGDNDLMVGGHNPPFVDSHGVQHDVSLVMDQWCGDRALNHEANGPNPLLQCLKDHDITGSVLKYQPGSRMGTFHLMENGLNLGLLAVSLLVAWWCVRRTRTTT